MPVLTTSHFCVNLAGGRFHIQLFHGVYNEQISMIDRYLQSLVISEIIANISSSAMDLSTSSCLGTRHNQSLSSIRIQNLLIIKYPSRPGQ